MREPDPARRRAAASEAMRAIARQRARRALRRLSLTESQARRVRRLLRDGRPQLAAAEEVLEECRHDLGKALAAPEPDATLLLELAVQERLLERRGRELTVRLEESLAALLRPDQALRLRALPEATEPFDEARVASLHRLQRLDPARPVGGQGRDHEGHPGADVTAVESPSA